MSTPSNHWKLGLFVVTSFALLIGTVLFLAAQSLHKETIPYKTYLDEAVTGLELGSPVKFRGVTVGSVSSIDVAPDRRHVELTMEFIVERIERLGLAQKEGRKTRIAIPPDLRTQLGSTGLTGVKYVQMDFFDPALYPAPALPFPVPENTIPAAPSALKNIEDSIVTTVQRMPEVLARLISVLDRTDTLVAGFQDAQLPHRTAELVAEVHATVKDARRAVAKLDTGKLSSDAQGTLAKIDDAASQFNTLLAAMQSDTGLMPRAEKATSAVGDVARNAKGVGRELEDTLRDVRDAAQSIQRLSDALEREPDMLLKGRTRAP